MTRVRRQIWGKVLKTFIQNLVEDKMAEEMLDEHQIGRYYGDRGFRREADFKARSKATPRRKATGSKEAGQDWGSKNGVTSYTKTEHKGRLPGQGAACCGSGPPSPFRQGPVGNQLRIISWSFGWIDV